MSGVRYREEKPQDDNTIAELEVKLWLDNGAPVSNLKPDKIQQTLDFIDEARSQYQLKTFIAEQDGHPVGLASGHLFHGLYPSLVEKKR